MCLVPYGVFFFTVSARKYNAPFFLWRIFYNFQRAKKAIVCQYALSPMTYSYNFHAEIWEACSNRLIPCGSFLQFTRENVRSALGEIPLPL